MYATAVHNSLHYSTISQDEKIPDKSDIMVQSNYQAENDSLNMQNSQSKLKFYDNEIYRIAKSS